MKAGESGGAASKQQDEIMKLRIKFSNTQKFTVQVEEENLKNLKNNITNYLFSIYGKNIDTLSLSFNGKDPIIGDDSSSLSSLGIVSGDLLTIIQTPIPAVTEKKELEGAAADVSATQSKNSSKINQAGDNMCSLNVKVLNLLEARDGTPPPSVFENFERYSPSSASEAINLLVHINMLEAGFILGESPNATKTLPSSWKEMAATFKYHHPGFQNFDCTIVIVTMGDIKQVLASFSGQDFEISVRLETREYLSSSQILPHRLTKMAQLARILRNKLLYPLQVAAHLTLGLPAPWHLVGLPQEVLVTIISMLNLRSVLHLSSTCKRLNTASKDQKVWYNIFKRDFADQFHSSDTISGADWRAKYKAAYEMKKKRDRSSENWRIMLNEPIPRQVYPPHFPNPNPDIDPFNPYMPQPRGPSPYYPPQPDSPLNPYWDPDSPYFGGEIPPPAGPFLPGQPNPLDPFRGRGPRRPYNPLQPPFMPLQPRAPRGPRFDFF